MPGIFITAKELVTGAVTFTQPQYDQATGKAREVRIFAVFPTANAPYAFPHALKTPPTGFTVVASGRNGGAPGSVYCDDLPIAFNKYSVVLKCSTANTWADIVLR